MAKAKIIPINRSGGEKIDFKSADAGIKRYWTLVNNDQIKKAHFPKSWSFDLHKLKAYLDEAEAEFTRMNVPYADRKIAFLPAFLPEKETFSVVITPSVTDADGRHQHQFNRLPKSAAKGKIQTFAAVITPNWQLDGLNWSDTNPPPPIQ